MKTKWTPPSRTTGQHLAMYPGVKAAAVVLTAVFCAAALPAVSAQPDPSLFPKKKLVAWCVVPFGKMKRTPARRAHDWRTEHLPSMAEEIRTLRKNNIKLKAVWFRVDGRAKGTIDEACEFVLKALEENDARAELWVSFNEAFFAGLTDREKAGQGREGNPGAGIYPSQNSRHQY